MPSPSPELSSHTRDQLSKAIAGGGPRIQRIELDGLVFWIKRPGETQAGSWHGLQRILAKVVPHPMLRVTVDEGGPASIERERARIEAFRHAGFHVPPVVIASPTALVLGDIGVNLGSAMKRDRDGFIARLPLIGETLGRVHSAGLAHGRPSRRDMTFHDGQIGFLDFEEDPQAAMPLAVAQARDVWLLFIDLARAGLAPHELQSCWSAYHPHTSGACLRELGRVTGWVSRAATLLQPLTAPFAGRDLKAPMAAARFLHAAGRKR